MVVNIYLYQTIKGPGKKSGAYTYILETLKDDKPITLIDTGTLEDMSENKAELTILLKALKRLRKECDLNIFTQSQHVITGLTEWIDKWLKAEWKNAKGQDIANKDEWQQIKEFRDKYKINCIHCATGKYNHTYEVWMMSETKKKERKKENVS